VKLKKNGGIVLDSVVSCDGFDANCKVRVQTHIHHDHMGQFSESKANQRIIASVPTRDLLLAELNADLGRRPNLEGIEEDKPKDVNGAIVELVASNHILGGVQVKLDTQDGYSIGYSSDFFWPMERPIKVDELVVDATYGDPSRVRRFTQQLVEEVLLEEVLLRLRGGSSVAVIGYRGRLQYAMHVLAEHLKIPCIASDSACKLAAVYEAHGYRMPILLAEGSDDAKSIITSRTQCIAFVPMPRRRHMPWIDSYAKVTLSAHMATPSNPLTAYGNGDFCLALTDHADFPGTIEYILATGAKKVWTDPRSGDAYALANALRREHGIKSEMLIQERDLGWG